MSTTQPEPEASGYLGTKFPKNRHFGDRFWLDSFFGRKPL